MTPKDVKQVAGPGFVQVRRQDIIIDPSAKGDKLKGASLEVCVHNFLLTAGLEVVSVDGGDMNAFSSTLKRLKNEFHPFVIYALDGKIPFSDEVCTCVCIIGQM